MPIKLFDLARELRKTNTEMMALGREIGIAKLSPASELDDETAGKLRGALGAGAATLAASANGAATPAVTAAPAPVADPGAVIEVPANITVKDLGDRLGVTAGDIQKVLMNLGVLAAVNQRLAGDAISRIASKLGRTVQVLTTAPVVAPVAPVVENKTTTPAPTANGAPTRKTAPASGNGSGEKVRGTTQAVRGTTQIEMTPRPPVVTIMGHVDHGKTTLLDTIRKTSVADREAGGITQHIGAYQVDIEGQRITFLDTPGHAAFSAMRARGTSVTDIVIIVVAADDGVMPQTEEAIKIAKAAGVPIVVAVNKIDKEDSNPDRVLTELMQYDLMPEAYGGDIQTVNISAKKNEGIKELLDTVLLVSEAVVDPQANPHGAVQGTIIEAKIDKGRGAVATVLVQQGTLRTGDVVVAGAVFGKVRGMADERGTKLVKAGPSSPVEIIGLSGVPQAGDTLTVAKNEKEARAQASAHEDALKAAQANSGLLSLEDLYKQLRSGPVKELNIVIKGDVQGSVQAVRDSLVDLGNSEVRARILTTGIGAITEGDVLLASSDKDQEEKNSLVVGFNVPITDAAKKKGESEHVQIKTYSIIYQLIDAVIESMVALLPPIYEEISLGKAEIRQLFRLPGGRKIAGAMVTDGLIKRNGKVRLYRGKELLITADVDTLKRFTEDAREVASGYECGLMLRGFNDLAVGDTMEAFEMRPIVRTLD